MAAYFEFEIVLSDGTKLIHKEENVDYFVALDAVNKMHPRAKSITPIFGFVSVNIGDDNHGD